MLSVVRKEKPLAMTNTDDTPPSGGGFGKIRVYGPLDLRIDGTYSKFGNKDIVDIGGTVTTRSSVQFGTIGGVLNLGTDSAAYPGDNSVSPYLIAGVGFSRIGCVGRSDCGVYTQMGWNAGLGMRLGLFALRGFTEARLHCVPKSEAEDCYIPVTVGLRF